ncbi:hypothetical protein C2G38_2194738 [Gigaspora rosea]|uniref:ELP3-like N-terminal domain-containing protein n=1 Tax=Gigaspora rosea TaxID=44941 RepID=A0A397V3Q1_9GLOM|nr:hypothetical protein C2G38_2194738 [Gigaspora rosea]
MTTKQKKGPTQPELMLKACSEIVNELITAHEQNKDVNLNGLKTKYSRLNKLLNQSKLNIRIFIFLNESDLYLYSILV